MTIHTLHSPVQLPELLSVARSVYEQDRNWVAPLSPIRIGRMLALRATRCDGHSKVLVARRAGQAVACGLILRDPLHDKHTDENVVFFGYFEAIDDEAGAALLDAAETQARAWGAKVLRGPRGFTRIDERGLLIKGAHIAPMMAGHHPLWYRELIERRGFTKHHDALAYAIDLVDAAGHERALPDKLVRKAGAVDLPGLEVRSCAYRSLIQDIDLAHEVMVEGFRDVPDNTPIPKAHFRALALPLLGVTDLAMLQIATVHGQAAGFALCFPELNEALRYAEGSMGPLAAFRVARGLSSIKTASFKLLGIVPQFRGTGLHAALIKSAIEGVRSAGYTRLEASLIDERNQPMRHIVEDSGMQVYRQYRVYERHL